MKGKTSKNTSTELSTNVLSLTDQLKMVAQQLKSLEKINESPYKTSGRMDDRFPSVKDCTDVKDLIKMAGFAKLHSDAFYAGADALGIAKTPAFKINGSLPEDWIADIKLRLQVLSTKKNYDTLKALQKELTDLMDKEDKLKLANMKLEKFMKEQGEGNVDIDVQLTEE